MKNKFQKILFITAIIFSTIAFNSNVKAQATKGFRVALFPGRFMEGNCLGTLTAHAYPLGAVAYPPDLGLVNPNTIINMRDYGIDDKAKSVLISATAGVTLNFFNNADGDSSRGICIVEVKQNFTGYLLDSFERTYEDNYVKVTYWKNGNGLNGQVSCIIASY